MTMTLTDSDNTSLIVILVLMLIAAAFVLGTLFPHTIEVQRTLTIENPAAVGPIGFVHF